MHGIKASSFCLGYKSSKLEREPLPKIPCFTSLVQITNHEFWMNLDLPEKARTFLRHQDEYSGWNEVSNWRSFAQFLAALQMSYSGVSKTQTWAQSYVMKSKNNVRTCPAALAWTLDHLSFLWLNEEKLAKTEKISLLICCNVSQSI